MNSWKVSSFVSVILIAFLSKAFSRKHCLSLFWFFISTWHIWCSFIQDQRFFHPICDPPKGKVWYDCPASSGVMFLRWVASMVFGDRTEHLLHLDVDYVTFLIHCLIHIIAGYLLSFEDFSWTFIFFWLCCNFCYDNIVIDWFTVNKYPFPNEIIRLK